MPRATKERITELVNEPGLKRDPALTVLLRKLHALGGSLRNRLLARFNIGRSSRDRLAQYHLPPQVKYFLFYRWCKRPRVRYGWFWGVPVGILMWYIWPWCLLAGLFTAVMAAPIRVCSHDGGLKAKIWHRAICCRSPSFLLPLYWLLGRWLRHLCRHLIQVRQLLRWFVPYRCRVFSRLASRPTLARRPAALGRCRRLRLFRR